MHRIPESLYKGTLGGLPPAVTGSIGKGVMQHVADHDHKACRPHCGMEPSFTTTLISSAERHVLWLTGLFQVTNIIFVFESLSTLDSTFTSAAKLLGPEFAGNSRHFYSSKFDCKSLLQALMQKTFIAHPNII